MTSTLQNIDDCWNRIGVNGNQQCPELPRVVHCRNCAVYADAAQRNLQRPIDAAYRAQWAAHFSEAAAPPLQTDRTVLVFRLGREWLALPAAMVDSVAPLAPGHRLPHRSTPALLGIVSVAGKLTPWLALETLLGIDAGTADDDSGASAGRHVFSRLLVLQAEGQRFAVRAAELHGIVRYRHVDLGAAPATVNKGLERLIAGVLAVGERRVGVLDGALLGHHLNRSLR